MLRAADALRTRDALARGGAAGPRDLSGGVDENRSWHLDDDAERRPETADLAARLPDEPVWLDTRAMLLSGRCQVLALDSGRGLRTSSPATGRSRWSVGRPAPALVHEAARSFHGMRMSLVVRPEDRAWVTPLVPTWQERRVLLHTRHGALPPVAAGADVRRFDASSLPPLDHVPAELRREVRLALGLSAPRAAARASDETASPAPVSVAAAFAWRAGRGVLLSSLADGALVGRGGRHAGRLPAARARRSGGEGP